VHDALAGLVRRLPLEDISAEQQVTQHYADREKVRPLIGDLKVGLLGAHVIGFARHYFAFIIRQKTARFGDAEIGQFYVALEGNHDVLETDVAMDDAERFAVAIRFGVGVGEAAHHPAGDEDRHIDGEEALFIGHLVAELFEVDAPNQFHGNVEDSPRFAWRGMHLDASRHFMPREFVKKFIDLLALHKMNSFHWHLTDDQGWRIEIKKYPRLTQVGGWRKQTLVGQSQSDSTKRVFDGQRHGGFYTQDDVREIVAYAASRFINVVPEIEMPGHAQAAIAAYPELGNTGQQLDPWDMWGVSEHILNPEDKTVAFMQDVLAEVLTLFPSRFIHVGGDEAVKNEWKASPRVQERIRELGLKDEHELQSWFIRQMDTYLTHHGRRLIGWDEILEGGLAPNATVMSWRGTAGGLAAARQDHDVVMAPSNKVYFDYYQSLDKATEPLAIGGFNPLDSVYAYDPVPPELEPRFAKHILGAQGQLWAEYLTDTKHVEYMAFPRVSALAETVWTPKDRKDYTDFSARLPLHLQRLDILDVNYRKP